MLACMHAAARLDDRRGEEEAVAAIRAFNRFYTQQLGLLDRGLLGSEFSLTESRILYELEHRGECTASDIATALGIDLGYLSRVLKSFSRRGLLVRTRSRADARQTHLKLSRAGRSAFAPLDRAARAQIHAMLEPIGLARRETLIAAVRTVQRLLGPGEACREYRLRDLRTGDVGWITHRQGLLYAREYGWDGTYEALVAQILADYVRNHDAERERAWIAEQEEAIIGSVFLVRASEQIAKLRLLYVEPHARGLGVGRRLVDECVAFARQKGYATLTLWTNDCLSAARRIYEAVGFRLSKEEAHHSFGQDLVGQTWELALRGEG